MVKDFGIFMSDSILIIWGNYFRVHVNFIDYFLESLEFLAFMEIGI
jgi:hypothetical protein